MTTVVAVLAWLTLIGLAAWRPDLYRRRGAWLVLAGVIAALALSPFWWTVARGLLDGLDLPLAGPAAAFASVWMLVLLPILQRRLDLPTLARTLYTGLVAAAALGMALEISHLALLHVGTESLAGPGAAALVLAILGILYVAGFALCLLAMPAHLPWDYAGWYSGLLLMTQTAAPLPIEIAVGAGHGVWALGVALAMSVLLGRYLRG